jgi:hypothetical protein
MQIAPTFLIPGTHILHPVTGETLTVTEVRHLPFETQVSYSVVRGTRTDTSFLSLPLKTTVTLV